MTDAASDPRTEQVFETIEAMRRAIVMTLIESCSIPAVSPESGGEGELRKTEWLQEHIRSFGFDEVTRYDVVDESETVRPNLVALRKGASEDASTLWFVSHTDVVPEGDISLWETDPWQPVIVDDKVVGRGVEDNGTPLVASLYAVRALAEASIRTGCNLGCVLVADEESGSKWGIQYLLGKDIFKSGDLVMVPDAGFPPGDFIEVAEKSILWLKFKTEGLQGHSSMPHMCKNAHEAGNELAYMLNKELKETYEARDELFDPPYSTFELTMKVANVSNVNTIPGEDVFYIDCRLLPQYRLADMLTEMRSVADGIETDTGATIMLDPILMDDAAPPTPVDAPVVVRLLKAIRAVYGNEPYAGGIGGGTCAAVIRRAGIHAAVWERVANNAHAPNEYAVIDNMVNDCKVLAHMFVDEG